MSGLAAAGGEASALHWQGGSQEAAYKLAMERAAMEGPAPTVAPAAPLPGAERPEVVCMADTDVSVGIEAAGLLHPKLHELELNHCRVGRIGSLESAPALQRLELRDNGLTAIEGLEGLSALTSLDLQGNRIEKIGDTLALCSNLTYVDLSYNALSFKKPEALSAEYLPHLKELFLAENQIKTARGLAAVSTSLTQLDIGSNRLKVVGPELGRLVNMRRLFLGANRIGPALDGIEPLENLVVLSLQSNRLISCSGLEGMRNLKELYLSENKIVSLDGLPLECPELTILDIAHNQLRSLSGVSAYPSLEDVWANTNQFHDLSAELAELAQLPKLTTVYLHYNSWEKPLRAAGADVDAEAEADDTGSLVVVDRSCFRPVGWSVHYRPRSEELLSKAEYTASVLEALPRLGQLDDTYR